MAEQAPAQHAKVRALALDARAHLTALRELADESGATAAALRGEAARLTLAAAREAGSAAPQLAALEPRDDAASPPSAYAIRAALAALPWRTRSELLWLRVVRCVAAPSLLFAGLFTLDVVRHRMPVAPDAAQPAPRPAQPPRPMPRLPGTPP